MNPVVFTCWTGTNPMSPQRRAALESLRKNCGVRHVHVTRDTLPHYIHADFPLHPLFHCLSAVHQSDYLRCYLLHVRGGGYSDIKPTTKHWAPFFEAIEASDCLGAGYRELGPHGVASVGGELEQTMRQNYQKLIGCCAMVFRPATSFTTRWYSRLIDVMDSRAAQLERHPARNPYDRRGGIYEDGTASQYPMGWTELMGKIFHPLVYEHHDSILQLDMAPFFDNTNEAGKAQYR
jgi:hypothetical protein